MKLVTVATHSERYFPYLKLSAERNGHELVVLGWGEKWQGFTWKFLLIKEYLQSIHPNEIVCFIDGYDVLVLQDPYTIEEKFLKLVGNDTNKIFISNEQYSHNGIENMIISYLQSFIFTQCKNKYINSGTYVGTASTLSRIFKDLCDEFKCNPNTDDQLLLGKYCANHSDMFIIDIESNMFLVINSTISKIKEGEYDISFLDDTLIYKNNIYPAFFHGNGYTNFDYIIQSLGYDTTIFSADGESKIKYVWDRFLHFFSIIFQRVVFYIFLFIVFLYVFRKYIFKIKNKLYNYRLKR